MPRSSRGCCIVLLLGLAACGSFEGTLLEFDLATGIDEERPTQGVVGYADNVAAWKTAAEAAATTVPALALENPTAFTRERIIELIAYSRGDLRLTAQVAPRLLVIAVSDPSALNRLEAVEGIADILGELGVDVIARVLADAGAVGARAAALDVVRALSPAGRGDTELTAEDRARYLEALDLVASGPMLSPLDDIAALFELSLAERAEPDGELAEKTRAALRETIANDLARTLVGILRSPDVRQREAAARGLYRLAGSRSLPLILSALSRSEAGIHQYPLIARERRTMLRLCSQTGGEVLFARVAGGPRPIEFIYETASRDEDEGLRLIALETMARCLGRAISFKQDWADAWWREFALSEGG